MDEKEPAARGERLRVSALPFRLVSSGPGPRAAGNDDDIPASPLQPFRKWLGRVKLRIDYHLALLVDVAPLASALITNPHCRQAIRNTKCGIKLRIDDNTPGLFGDLCDGSMSVRRPDEEDSRVVNGFANDHHESSTAPG